MIAFDRVLRINAGAASLTGPQQSCQGYFNIYRISELRWHGKAAWVQRGGVPAGESGSLVQPRLEDQLEPGTSTTLKPVRSSVTNSPREAAKRMPGTPSLFLLLSHPPPRATLSRRFMSPTHSSQTLPSTSYKPYLLAFPVLPTSSGFA